MFDLLVALAVGLLIGIERGWHARAEPDGKRLAGIRTFTLIGLLGGVCALIARQQGSPWLLALALLGLAAILAVGHYRESQADGEAGITTVIAALLTFVLAALALYGLRLEAIAMAALTAALLSLKAEIHGWLRKVEQLELHTALQLLVVAAVVLPLLPEAGMGPWEAVVPRKIGWLVLLIAGLSFAGYIAVKLIGARLGLLAMGAFGGLASSTAVVLHLSSRLKQASAGTGLIAAAMLAACSVMGPRVLAITGLIAPPLLAKLALPITAMTLPLIVAGAWQMRAAGQVPEGAELELSNPMSLFTAAKFALLMAAVMVAVASARETLGDNGVLAAAAISGIVDADAISLSLAEMAAGTGETVELAARGILIALTVNNAVKATMSIGIGGRAALKGVTLPLLSTCLVGTAFAIWP